MNEKAMYKRRICELDFALHELVLYLDVHPMCKKALELMGEYRKMRKEAVMEYEKKFGPYIVTPSDVPLTEKWKWINSPWPWENNFMEA